MSWQKNPFLALIIILLAFSLPALSSISNVSEGRTNSSGQAVSNAEIAKRIDEFLTRLQGFSLSGTVLVAKDGQIIFHKGYGSADRSKGIANNTETVFDIGSIAKQFTAAAILKLEMQGKLNTNDPISKYLEDVPTDKQSITIHQLLGMNSGVMVSPGPDGTEAMRDREKRVRQLLAAPLNFPPGKRFEYSNGGYNLAAAIVERVSGQSLQQFLYEQLFRPAGMTSTGFQVPGFNVPGWESKTVARYYTGNQDNGHPWAGNSAPWFLKGPGGILSTPADLYKWHQALLGDKILSAEVKKKLYTPVVMDYAYGWSVRNSAHGKVIQHDGGTSNGAGNDFIRYLDAGVTITYSLNNSGEDFLRLVSSNLRALALGDTVNMPPTLIQLPASALEKYTGKYKLADGGDLIVTRDASGLFVSAGTPEALGLLYNTNSSDKYKDLEAIAVKIAEGVLKGDHTPLYDAFGGSRPLEQVKTRQQQVWQERQAQSGQLKGFKVLGTLPGPEGNMGTVVRYDLERGAIYLQYMWGRGTLAVIRPLEGPPGLAVLPTSEKEFVRYDVLSGNVTRVSFNVGASGRVSDLTIALRQQQLSAKRAE